jgi:hypothetical protein
MINIARYTPLKYLKNTIYYLDIKKLINVFFLNKKTHLYIFILKYSFLTSY